MREQLIPYNEKMEKTLSVLAADFASIRAGRANPGVLDRVNVEYYGSMTPVNQVAAVSVSEARILVIQPWDRSCLKLIEKAINASDIGIPPQNDGVCIRLVFPPLTEERRKDLCKTIAKHSEEAKVNMQTIHYLLYLLFSLNFLQHFLLLYVIHMQDCLPEYLCRKS